MDTKYLATNIEWDTDGEKVSYLPESCTLSRRYLVDNGYIDEDDDDEYAFDRMADALSDIFGWCIIGLNISTKWNP